jgi:hypothetical protein
MSIEAQITQIIDQYKKHGWNLSRVLLSASSRNSIDAGVFGHAPIIESDLDAAWFTRSSTPGHITWELRALSGTPFAVLEVFDVFTADDEREERLKAVEQRLRQGRIRHTGH